MTDPATAREALAQFRAGALDRAQQLSEQVLRRRPRDATALNVLGLVHNARGAHLDAAKAFRRLTELEGAQVPHWVNLGTALRAAGKLDEALGAYRKAAELGERSAAFAFNLGLLHLDRGAYVEALPVLATAAAGAPQDAEIRLYYARTCYDCVRNDEAIAALRDWRGLEGLTADLLCDIGTLLLQLGMTDEAQAALVEAQHRQPDHARTRMRVIQLLERMNRVDEANAAFAQLVAPVDLRDDVLRIEAQLAQRNGDAARARDRYEQLLTRAATAHDREALLFPLAKACDSTGDFDGAFEALQQAHAAQMAFLRQSAPRFQRDPLDIVNYGCDPDDVRRWNAAGAPDVKHSPVFVVAFPRSGTTLLEQMLDAHPDLRAMDEQPFLQDAIARMQAHGARYPEALAGLTDSQLEDARAHYWARVATQVALLPGQRLVDKNPLNLLRLPAIARLFPNARILLALRHPCDVVLSCYSQHFRAPDFASLCSTLPGLAQGFVRTFDFWDRQAQILGPSRLTLRYESLVADVEKHAREIAAFLDIAWSPSMLDPARNARQRGFISTPSYAQVVQPVNTKAVGRWRRYARHLQGVLPILEPRLRQWGYEA